MKRRVHDNRQWRSALATGLLLLGLLLGGCAPKVHTGGTASVVTPDFFGLGNEIARQLVANYRPGGRPQGVRVLLATVVEIDDLYATSRFGRTLTESLATQLFRHGLEVEEVRKAGELMIKEPGGELVLSRDVSLLANQHQVNAVVAGTYSLTPKTVIVNIRMLDAASQAVLSVAGVEIQRSAAINHLLIASSGGGLQDAGLSGRER